MVGFKRLSFQGDLSEELARLDRVTVATTGLHHLDARGAHLSWNFPAFGKFPAIGKFPASKVLRRAYYLPMSALRASRQAKSVAAAPLAGIRVVDDVDQAFRAGDDDGLRRAYEAHGSLVYTFCRRAIPDAASDLTQETFLAAWRARHQFDPDRGPLQAWLIGIAKNKVIDAHRKQGRRVAIADTPRGIDVAISDRSKSPVEAAVDQLGDRMLLTEALMQLSDRGRLVIEHSFFEGLTHAEIAERTGLPLGTVKSDIRRGLNRLRRFLESPDE